MDKNPDQLYLHLVWVDPSNDEQQTLMTLLDSLKTITIGSDDNNTVVLKDTQVSRQHAKLEQIDGKVLLTDLKSMNQTFVDGEAIDSKVGTPLQNGDRFTIRPVVFAVGIQPSSAYLIVRWSKAGDQPHEKTVDLPILLGRDGNNSIVLPDEQEHVSRHHATIEQHGDELVLIDCSFNGTYVNDERYKEEQVTIKADDEIQIGAYTINVARLGRLGESEKGNTSLGVTRPIPNTTVPIPNSSTHQDESQIDTSRKTMIWRLVRHWLTRFLLFSIIGLIVMLVFDHLYGNQTTLFALLGYLLLIGFLSDILYRYQQSLHWYQDSPAVFQLFYGIIQGMFVWILTLLWEEFDQFGLPHFPGLSPKLTFALFVTYIVMVWFIIFATLKGLLQLIFLRWASHNREQIEQ